VGGEDGVEGVEREDALTFGSEKESCEGSAGESEGESRGRGGGVCRGELDPRFVERVLGDDEEDDLGEEESLRGEDLGERDLRFCFAGAR
jgi:hypothetical protein